MRGDEVAAYWLWWLSQTRGAEDAARSADVRATSLGRGARIATAPIPRPSASHDASLPLNVRASASGGTVAPPDTRAPVGRPSDLRTSAGSISLPARIPPPLACPSR